MPKDKNEIILIFGNKQKNSKIPNDLKKLKKICEEELGLTDIENFSFYYRDKNSIDFEINENNFNECLSEIKNSNRNKIIIKESFSNSTQSELYNIPSTNSRLLLDIQNNISNNESENKDSFEYYISRAEELFSGSNSELSKFYSQENIGIMTSKSHMQFIKQFSDNDSVNQNSSRNRSINSNHNSSENNSELNKSNSMNTIHIQVLSEEEYKIKQLDLENKALKEKISILESKIKSKDLIINNLNKKIDEIVEDVKRCDEIKKANDDLYKNNKDLEKKINNFKQEINKLQEKNRELLEVKKVYIEQIKIRKNQENQNKNDNIKCNDCGIMPIKGYRYQCSFCENYNLCQQCSEKILNEFSHRHLLNGWNFKFKYV